MIEIFENIEELFEEFTLEAEIFIDKVKDDQKK
jgi:hypothetical protein